MTRASGKVSLKSSSKLHDVGHVKIIKIGKDVSVRGMYYSIV